MRVKSLNLHNKQEEKQQAERKELMKGIKKKERKEIKTKGKKPQQKEEEAHRNRNSVRLEMETDDAIRNTSLQVHF